jgi:hypothetical protein
MRGMDRGQLIEELTGRALAIWRWAASEVDKLGPDEFWVPKLAGTGRVIGTEPHHRHTLERAAAEEVERLVALAENLGLADRLLKLEEQQSAAVGHALRAACAKIGMSADEQRELALALRDELTPMTRAREMVAA